MSLFTKAEIGKYSLTAAIANYENLSGLERECSDALRDDYRNAGSTPATA